MELEAITRQEQIIAGKDLQPVTRMEFFLKAYGGGGSGGGAQPDWNQNDSAAADYVKNRPFYTGDPVETVLVEESTVSFANSGGSYVAEFSTSFNAEFGKTYKVSWDGTVYECVCYGFNDHIPVIGNQSETLEMVLQAAEYLDDEYVTTKILTLLGDADKAQEVLKRKDAEAADRYKQMETELEDSRNKQNHESEGE